MRLVMLGGRGETIPRFVDPLTGRKMFSVALHQGGEPIIAVQALNAAGGRHFFAYPFVGRRALSPSQLDPEIVGDQTFNHGPLIAQGGGATVGAYWDPVATRIRTRRSLNMGRTWGAIVTPAAIDIAGVLPESVDLMSDGGTLFLFWKVAWAGNLFFTSSADGGLTWAAAVDTTLAGPSFRNGNEGHAIRVSRSSAGTWIVLGGDPALPNGGSPAGVSVWRSAALTGPWGAPINLAFIVFGRMQLGGVFRRSGGVELVAVYSELNGNVLRRSSLDDGLTWAAEVGETASVAPFFVNTSPVPIFAWDDNLTFEHVDTHTAAVRVTRLFTGVPNASDLIGVTPP